MGSRIDGSAIDKVLEEAVGTGAVPHVAAIAADRDGVLYEGGAGVRIMGESDDPVTTATQFRIMSMTKTVCAAAALQQVERGETAKIRKTVARVRLGQELLCSSVPISDLEIDL